MGPAATARHAGDALLDAASDLRTGSDCDSGPGTGARPLGKATSIQRRSAQMQAAAAQLACALGQEAQGDPGRQAAEEAAVMLLQLARHVDLLQRGNDSLAANVAALRRGGALAPAAGGPQPEQGLALAEQGAAAASGGGSSAAPVQGPISGAEAGEQAAVHVAARVQELETRARWVRGSQEAGCMLTRDPDVHRSACSTEPEQGSCPSPRPRAAPCCRPAASWRCSWQLSRRGAWAAGVDCRSPGDRQQPRKP